MGPFEVDHRVPLSRGGTNDFDNLACACVSCNTQKASYHLHEWIQWRKTNGMPWPPIARHATDPRHYPDHCTPCWRRPDSEMNGAVAYRLEFDGTGYKCYFRCECGERWTCGWALATWYYSDCPCDFCISARLEEEGAA